MSRKRLDPGMRKQLEENARKLVSSDCPICNGMGYHYELPVAHRQEGSYRLCECMENICRCGGKYPYEYYDSERNGMVECPTRRVRMALEKIEILRRFSGIPGRYQHSFFSTIDMDPVLYAFDHSIEAVNLFGKKEMKGLYFYGAPGCGKTLLSCVILNEILRLYRVGVKYAKISRDVLGKLRASFNPNSEHYGAGQKIEEELATVPVLVIDDFGVHRESEWVNLVLYDLVDSRYENDLLTIITSNEPLESWREIAGGRIYSRLTQMCAEVHIEAPDYRQRYSKKF